MKQQVLGELFQLSFIVNLNFPVQLKVNFN